MLKFEDFSVDILLKIIPDDHWFTIFLTCNYFYNHRKELATKFFSTKIWLQLLEEHNIKKDCLLDFYKAIYSPKYFYQLQDFVDKIDNNNNKIYILSHFNITINFSSFFDWEYLLYKKKDDKVNKWGFAYSSLYIHGIPLSFYKMDELENIFHLSIIDRVYYVERDYLIFEDLSEDDYPIDFHHFHQKIETVQPNNFLLLAKNNLCAFFELYFIFLFLNSYKKEAFILRNILEKYQLIQFDLLVDKLEYIETYNEHWQLGI